MRLTQQLLAFSKRQITPPEVMHPTRELARLMPLLATVVGRGVVITTDIDQNCAPIVLSPSHFEQLVVNLSANASHAMDGQGELQLRLSERRIEADEIEGLRSGEYVELRVKDFGVGIEPEALSHLFEPFFTTRGAEGGSGLGLATCYGIVTQHGGRILVESSPGAGALFLVLLPVAAGTELSADARERSASLPATTNVTSTVLVVDDEPALREIAVRMLAAPGCEVIAAESIAEARGIIENPRQHLDVVLTDVVLLGGLGTDLLERVRALRPGVRLCVMSAFLPGPDVEAVIRSVGATFVAKPFQRQALLAAIRG
jgi:CheY-like chemotaxis protein